jgi:hypothetical protein
MPTDVYPPISLGTWVRTTEPNPELRNEWTEEGLEKRRWNVQGIVVGHHDSHGLCYDIRHEDDSIGCYDPSELEVIGEGELEHPWCGGCGHRYFADAKVPKNMARRKTFCHWCREEGKS